jgi:hypothetical protein
LGDQAKVVFDSDRGVLRIWQKGWIGKRKYRIRVDEVSAVMYGWYTSRIRLPMRGFNLEFQHKGKNVVVTIPGEHKRFIPQAEEIAKNIGRSAGLSEFKVDGASVFFSRTNPGGETVAKPVQLAADGTPLTKTEQVLSGAARGTKNIAGEIVSDAGNAVSGIGKVILYGIGGIVFLALLGTNPILAFFLLGLGVYLYRKNR